MRRHLRMLLPAFILCSSAAACARVENGGTFAIQNVGSGMNLRPLDARNDERNQVILYDHHWWKCLTWEFSRNEDGEFRLANFYTGKWLDSRVDDAGGISLMQSSAPRTGVAWEFASQSDGSYSIRMSGTDLYVTATAAQNNSQILLKPLQQGSNTQKWRLVAQRPWF